MSLVRVSNASGSAVNQTSPRRWAVPKYRHSVPPNSSAMGRSAMALTYWVA